MADAVALALYLPLLIAAAVVVWRRPVVALYAFVVGLAVHNLVMVLLYDAGVRGGALTVIQAWKEILLATALASVVARAVRERRLPFAPAAVDVLALAFAAVVLVYATIPQDVLGGEAGAGAIAYAARHALLPVAAYALGRSLALGVGELRRLAIVMLGTAAGVAAFGLVEVYAVSLDWWRASGAPGWFRTQLDLEYRGLSGLPENFVYNPGNERPLRRLVSTFLSPLATAYLLVVALLFAGTWRRTGWVLAVAALLLGALLFTHTRAAFLALALGLAALALVRRAWWPAAAAVGVVALGAAFVEVYPSIAPETRFTPAELQFQREQARRAPAETYDPLDPDEPSLASHWRNLRDGAETVLRHPQGYGLGNAGTVARRFDEPVRAGESNYTELGVETGIAGLALFVAWALALVLALIRRARDGTREGARWAASLAAALVAVLALAVQTDAIGVPWLAYCVFALAGAVAAPAPMGLRATATARASVEGA